MQRLGVFNRMSDTTELRDEVKSADEILAELVKSVRAPPGVTISVADRPSRGLHGPNWIAGIGVVPVEVQQRFDQALDRLRQSDPIIDWTGIESRRGDRRRIGLNLPEDLARDD